MVKRRIKKRTAPRKVTETTLPYVGDLTAPVLIILDPVVGNTNFKMPLSKSQMQWFADHLANNGGFKKKDVCIISCAPPVDGETWGLGKLISAHLKEHRDELLNIIDRNRPKLILPFGAKACQQVIGRSVQITKVRGQAFQEEHIAHNIPVLPMLSPFYAQRQPENEAAFVADLQTARRIYEDSYNLEASAIDYKHDYQWCWDVKKLRRILKGKRRLSVDVEGVGLLGFAPDTCLLTIQICYEEGKSINIPINYDRGKWRHHNFIPWDKIDRKGLIRILKKTFEDPRVEIFGQNFKFDWLYLYYQLGITVANYSDDTMLLAHLHDENQRRINIDDLVRQHVPEMAGFNDCVAPATRLLKADHTWVRADELQPGDELVGFDEHVYRDEGNARRKMRRSVINSICRRMKPGYRITMKSGRVIEVSNNHEFLFKRSSAGGALLWRQANQLRVGDVLATFPMNERDQSFEGGWLSGILDGEGFITDAGNGVGFRLGWSQNRGPVLDKSIEVCERFTEKPLSTWCADERSCVNVSCQGWDAYAVLQSVTPERLTLSDKWEGKSIPVPVEQDAITAIDYLGEIETVSIETSTHTFIAEGICSHNCYNNDPDHHGKSRMDLLPPEKMLPYGCGDTDAAWRLCGVLKDKIKEDKGRNASLIDTYEKVTMPAQRAFCWIELNGFPVSKRELNNFEKKLKAIQKRERIYLLRQIPQSIKDKWKDSGVGLKVTRAAILRDWLYTHPDGMQLEPVVYTKTKEPSISSKQALPFYVADHPIISRLIDYIKNDKLLNTYAKGFHKYIYEGLIRPSYGLAGTVTGRSMSRDPNGQNFPKRGKLAKEYRKVFKAPKGWAFISCDLSQAELRIAAMMSGDENMLKVYADGGDIHASTAAGVMGISVEEFMKLDDATRGLKRFQAKAVNFGFLYGMWWVKFRQYAKTDYGIDFTEDEAKETREMFFRTYPMLEDWHRDVQRYVSKSGKIRTFDGRLRHLPNVFSPDEGVAKQAMRQAINSPVQSIGSDLGLMTLGRLIPHINEHGLGDWIKPCGFIHDAIVCLVREDKIAAGCDLVKTFMENNPLEEWFNWTPEIPIIADAEFGRTLAETYEISPDMFVGKENAHKSYDDLVKELDEREAAKKAEKASTVETKRRKIKIKRSNPDAKRKTAKKAEIRSARVRRRPARVEGRRQRRKPAKDKAA